MGMYKKRSLKKIAKRCNLGVEFFRDYMKQVKALRKMPSYRAVFGK